MNIVLVGFMGTGKTSVAKKLSKLTGLPYISTDELIEERENKSINDIFEQNGEPYFRKAEKEIVREISQLDGIIIDAGGGVMLDEENIRHFKNKGVIICLNARSEVILKRMQGKKNRPLLNVSDKLARIKELLDKRESSYKKADNFIDTSDLNVDAVIEEIRKILNLRF